MVPLKVCLLTCALSAPGDPVLLEFTAKWCGYCRQMEPTIERLESVGFQVRQIDVDENRQLAQRFRVSGLPCFVVLKNGREVDRIVGKTNS